MSEEIKGTPIEETIPQVDNAIQGIEYDIEDEIPYVIEEPGHIRFTWRKHCVEIEARHFDYLNKAHCSAELEVWFDSESHRRLMLPITRVDLKSASSRRGISTHLRTDNELWVLNWDWMIDCVAFKLIDLAQRQEATVEVRADPNLDITPVYTLKPILYQGHPTVIFGDKNSGKSLIAIVISYVVQLPLVDNKLGWVLPDNKACFVLYLDYEDERLSFQQRWTGIERGFNLEGIETTIQYRHMTTRLADSVSALRSEIIDKHIGLLIVDSLGPAAGGNLYDPQPALEYHQALRALGVTSLTLAHNSKDIAQKRKSIFGSVFFSNLARSIWQSDADEDHVPNELTMSLTQVNANLSEIHGTLGYRFSFDNLNKKIEIEKLSEDDIQATSMRNRLSNPLQIRHELKDGAKTINQLAEGTGLPIDTVRTTVYRMARKKPPQVGKVGKVEREDLWGLLEPERE